MIDLEVKIEDENEKKIILALSEKNYDSYLSLSEATKISRPWLKKKIKKLELENVVKVKTVNKRSLFTLNKKKVKIKKFSWELLKQLLAFPSMALIIIFMLMFYFGVCAFPFVLGGIVVFISQIIYAIYKMLRMKETIEIFLK